MKDLANEQKEVGNVAIGKRSLDRFVSVTFAESFPLDVRVNDIVIRGGGMRIECFNPVGSRGAEPIDLENNREPTEIDLLKENAIGYDCQFA